VSTFLAEGSKPAAKSRIDFVALTARLEAAPFQNKIKTEVFQQTVKPKAFMR
jgi:hypothetical protein